MPTACIPTFQPPRKLEGPFQIGLQTKREQAMTRSRWSMRCWPTTSPRGRAQELEGGKAQPGRWPCRCASTAMRKLLGYLSVIGFYGLPLSYLDDFPPR
jgi:zinc protease